MQRQYGKTKGRQNDYVHLNYNKLHDRTWDATWGVGRDLQILRIIKGDMGVETPPISKDQRERGIGGCILRLRHVKTSPNFKDCQRRHENASWGVWRHLKILGSSKETYSWRCIP